MGSSSSRDFGSWRPVLPYDRADIADRGEIPLSDIELRGVGLSKLAELAHTAQEVKGCLALQAREAHELGASWAEIGAAVGLTRQGAQQCWGEERDGGKSSAP